MHFKSPLKLEGGNFQEFMMKNIEIDLPIVKKASFKVKNWTGLTKDIDIIVTEKFIYQAN